MSAQLPAGFEALARFLPDWNLATEKERHRKRVASDLAEVRAFYEAMTPRIRDAMRHLDTFPGSDPDDLPAAERNLYNLALSFMEVSHPIDLNWARPDIDDAFPVERMDYLGPMDQR